ncbi:MAG TPA: flippase [Candidatus Sulfotelmatobacter sp.]|nr:flippase [Candidatus Sulfotelmatobacter sp.]
MNPPTVDEAPDSQVETQKFRSQVGHISRHSGVFFAGTILTAAVGYLFKIYLARKLGAEALGIYSLGMTVVSLVGLFGGMGLTWAASRFPSVYQGRGKLGDLRSFLAWSLLSLVSVNTVLALAMLGARQWIAYRLYHTPALRQYLGLFALMMFLGALTAFFGQLLTGYKQVALRTLIANIGGVILTAVFTIVLVEMGLGLWGYIFGGVISAVVVLVFLIGAVVRFTPSQARSLRGPLSPPPKDMFSFAFAAFAMDVVGFLYSQTDKVILGFYLDARSVGIYAIAATIVAFLPIALQSVNQIFSPTIAELHAKGDHAMLNRLFQTLTKWIFALTLPLAVIAIVFSTVLMRVFGKEFEAGWKILVIGAIAQLVNCGVGSVGFLLLMSGRERRLVTIQFLVAVATVSCCLVLVPRWGLVGAAVAAAVGNAGANVWCLWEVKKVLGLFPYNRGYAKLFLPAVATIASAVGLRFALAGIGGNLLTVVIATMVVYGVFLGTVLISGLDSDDRLVANAVLARLRGWINPPQAGVA